MKIKMLKAQVWELLSTTVTSDSNKVETQTPYLIQDGILCSTVWIMKLTLCYIT